MVFNLYAVEGYKHKEIAEMLGIDSKYIQVAVQQGESCYKIERLRNLEN